MSRTRPSVALGGLPAAVKLLVAGGFGVGKTTMVASVSEIPPVSTETYLSAAARRRGDDTAAVPDKRATTVALDFGRITIDERAVVYLFGTPGQQRFWFMWDRLAHGALGAVVLVDLRRLTECFAPIDYLEQVRLPFAVVVNEFDDAPALPVASIREALAVGPHVPILTCDARQHEGATQALIALVDHVAARCWRRRIPAWQPPGRGALGPRLPQLPTSQSLKERMR